MIAKQFVETNDVQQGKTMLVKMVSMLFGLIRANSDVRVFESSEQYATEGKRNRNRNKSRIRNKNPSANRNPILNL